MWNRPNDQAPGPDLREVHGVDVAPTMVSLGREKMKDLTKVHLHETSRTDLGDVR